MAHEANLTSLAVQAGIGVRRCGRFPEVGRARQMTEMGAEPPIL